jgi:hypothetical protein
MPCYNPECMKTNLRFGKAGVPPSGGTASSKATRDTSPARRVFHLTTHRCLGVNLCTCPRQNGALLTASHVLTFDNAASSAPKHVVQKWCNFGAETVHFWCIFDASRRSMPARRLSSPSSFAPIGTRNSIFFLFGCGTYSLRFSDTRCQKVIKSANCCQSLLRSAPALQRPYAPSYLRVRFSTTLRCPRHQSRCHRELSW